MISVTWSVQIFHWGQKDFLIGAHQKCCTWFLHLCIDKFYRIFDLNQSQIKITSNQILTINRLICGTNIYVLHGEWLEVILFWWHRNIYVANHTIQLSPSNCCTGLSTFDSDKFEKIRKYPIRHNQAQSGEIMRNQGKSLSHSLMHQYWYNEYDSSLTLVLVIDRLE